MIKLLKIKPAVRLNLPKQKISKEQTGGAAIEYIIVSTFATLLAIAAIAFVSTSIKQKIEELEQKTGITFDQESINLFND